MRARLPSLLFVALLLGAGCGRIDYTENALPEVFDGGGGGVGGGVGGGGSGGSESDAAVRPPPIPCSGLTRRPHGNAYGFQRNAGCFWPADGGADHHFFPGTPYAP